MKTIFKSFCISALACIILACTSLQDVYVNLDEIEKSADILRIERTLAFLDGDYLANSTNPTFNAQDFSTNCLAVAADAEKSLSVQGLQKHPTARLLALEGRAYHLAKNTARAKNLHAQAAALYAGDTQAVILAHRLGIATDLQTAQANNSEKALLVLELAVHAFSNGNYSDAAAGFDTAFVSLDAFYREAYSDVREKAWNLRSVTSESSSAVLLQDAMTVTQMLSLTQQQSSLLFNYTAGKKLSDSELYKRISVAGLLSPLSALTQDKTDIPQNKTLATRFLIARFLWNLYNRNKTREQATRYSQALRTGNESPIPDVPLDAPDFDAALGCVENELLSLPDGEHFFGDDALSAVDFTTSLQKIK